MLLPVKDPKRVLYTQNVIKVQSMIRSFIVRKHIGVNKNVLKLRAQLGPFEYEESSNQSSNGSYDEETFNR